MYVCVCNALTDRQVQAAIRGGAENVGAVFRCHGCAMQCGKCALLLREMVHSHSGRAGGDRA